MLHETLFQGKMFLCFLYFGILCGILLTTKKLVDKTFKHKRLVVILTDIVLSILLTLIFVLAKIKFCFGQFRIFEVLAFGLGIFLEQFSLSNLVEKFLNICYTFFRRIFCKLKQTKFFGKILK